MSLVDGKCYFKKKHHQSQHISQGDIISDLTLSFGAAGKDTELDTITMPYIVVMSQECDLLQDFDNVANKQEKKNDDKCLPSILVCPAYNKELFQLGNHFGDNKMKTWNSKEIKKLLNNSEFERYHYLESPADFGVPELVIDFKHFYTFPRNTLYDDYKINYKTTISPLFKERVSQRFANYLCRIGLPETEDRKKDDTTTELAPG